MVRRKLQIAFLLFLFPLVAEAHPPPYPFPLNSAYDVGKSITADDGPVSITVPDGTDDIGLEIIVDDTTNDPNALELKLGTSTGYALLAEQNTATGTDAGGPLIRLQRNATLATFENIGGIEAWSLNSTPIFFKYGGLLFEQAFGVAGAESGLAVMEVASNGATARFMEFNGDALSLGFDIIRFNADFEIAGGNAYLVGPASEYAFRYTSDGTTATNFGLLFNVSTSSYDFTGGGGFCVQSFTTAGDLNLCSSGAALDMDGAGEALGIGDTRAGAITIGNATNTTSVTVTTDGTGTGELVLPNDSVGYAEIERFMDCRTIPRVPAGADDNMLAHFPQGVTITSSACRCKGACTVLATVQLQDGAGNAMTGAPTCASGLTATATFTPVTAGGALNAGELFVFDITNSQTANDDYMMCYEYTY